MSCILFPFGLVQLAVWIFYPAWWVLPVFGLIVGYATNWIALNLIFRPLFPKRILGWTVQGLFLKRQKEVAAVIATLLSHEKTQRAARIDRDCGERVSAWKRSASWKERGRG